MNAPTSPLCSEIRTGLVILARSDSARLPNKSLLMVADAPIIVHQMRRLRQARHPQRFVLATTTRPVDDALCKAAQDGGFEVFRGSPADVVKRLRDAAETLGLDLLLVAGGDDVFCAPELVDQLASEYEKSAYDFAVIAGAPFGTSPFAVTKAAIEKLMDIRADENTDGWERYFTETGLFVVKEFVPGVEYLRNSAVRLDLDYPEDFDLVKAIYAKLYRPSQEEPSLEAVMALFRREPILTQLNESAHRKWMENRAKTWPPIRLKEGRASSGNRGEL